MKIILRNSENLLCDKIESLPFKDHRLRCLHICSAKISDCDHEALIEKLKIEMKSYPSQLYLMQDDDIIIIVKGLLLRQFEQICENITPLLFGENSEKTDADMFHYYDLFKEYDFVRELVKIKKETAKTAPKKPSRILSDSEQQQQDDESASKLSDEEYKNLIKSIHKRRSNREGIAALVIDDDDFTRKLIASSIEQEYPAESAQNGFTGINAHIKMAPDITFLDIEMPDINGQVVLEKILKIDPNAFVVMLSSHKDQQNVMKAVQTGAKGFIGKPFKKEKLFKYLKARERDKNNALGNVASP